MRSRSDTMNVRIDGKLVRRAIRCYGCPSGRFLGSSPAGLHMTPHPVTYEGEEVRWIEGDNIPLIVRLQHD